jgi:cytochrome b6-f complex iron-sulfur subunit
MKDPLEFKVIDRRDFVTRGCGVFAACLTVQLWTLLGGCAPNGGTEDAGPLKLVLAELPLNRRVRIEHDGRAVEVVRTPDGVTARSLLCTHQGCNVRWIEDQQIYLCPCHEGKFNAKGQPTYGPPREPLREIDVTVTGTQVIIG